MTSPIFFNVKEAREQLMGHGIVYSVRHSRQTCLTAARHGSFFKFVELCKVRVTVVLLLHEEGREVQLADYVKDSGFQTVQDWIAHVQVWKSPMYLYKVEAQNAL
jgi:hypothetical protein